MEGLASGIFFQHHLGVGFFLSIIPGRTPSVLTYWLVWFDRQSCWMQRRERGILFSKQSVQRCAGAQKRWQRADRVHPASPAIHPLGQQWRWPAVAIVKSTLECKQHVSNAFHVSQQRRDFFQLLWKFCDSCPITESFCSHPCIYVQLS